MNVDEIARHMAAWSVSPDIQVMQTEYRLDLAETWQKARGCWRSGAAKVT